ncbi:hypothetical protein C474_15054 [Halogeometricum pallidum JCM 14848]|uniref:Uncharacterized protein n=1 Tax=Halogeometricum pallidum JCM 14848 TaxID=1227487 RepID=M0D173_HALPD|nr:hypothetical protein C474_15054 [Halogeometricum pallidum JCM 14848]
MNVSEVVPPRFEVRKLSLYLVACWNLVHLVEFVEDVIVELPTSINVMQERLDEGFRWVESVVVVHI